MFGYTAGPGGIRRGLVWQSGGVKASPAYLWDKGPFSFYGAGGDPECYINPARLEGISPFKSGDNYNIFKIDMFMGGDEEYKNSSYSKMSPAGESSIYGRAYSPDFGAEFISLPYRLYGYIYMHYEPFDIKDNTADNQNAWYAEASSILNGYDLSSFSPGSNKITYNVEDGEFYTPQVLRFNPVEKYPGETIDNNYIMPLFNSILRTRVSKSYYESNQVRITNNADFSFLCKQSDESAPDISSPVIHQIAFSLPRVNTNGKVQQIVPQIYKSTGLSVTGLVLRPSKASYEEIPAETVGYKKANSWAYHPDFIIDSTIDTVKMSYTAAGLFNLFNYDEGDLGAKWAYSFKGAVQPFVNMA